MGVGNCLGLWGFHRPFANQATSTLGTEYAFAE